MKKLLLFFYLGISLLHAAAQQPADNREKKKRNSGQGMHQKGAPETIKFHERSNGVVKEYSYTLQEKELVRFTCAWVTEDSTGRTETFQSFEQKQGRLIQAYEQIVSIYNQKDSAIWSCNYIFKNGKLADMSSLGHGKSEDDSWEPGTEVPGNYNQVLRQINRHRKQVKSR